MNKYMLVSVCVSVSAYVCLSISPHPSFSPSFSLPFSLSEFVCVNFFSQLWRKNILHFSPCSDPRAELSYVLAWSITLLYIFLFYIFYIFYFIYFIILYCIYFFSFISWVLALCVSVATRELGWIWGKISSLLLSILQCGSAALASWTEDYIIGDDIQNGTEHMKSACVHATFVHTDSEKTLGRTLEEMEGQRA